MPLSFGMILMEMVYGTMENILVTGTMMGSGT